MELEYGADGTPFVMWGDNRIQLEVKLKSEDTALKEKAKKELRETPEVVEQALREFRKLLKSK